MRIALNITISADLQLQQYSFSILQNHAPNILRPLLLCFCMRGGERNDRETQIPRAILSMHPPENPWRKGANIMTVRERERSRTLTVSSVCFQLMLTYRIPMRVEDAVIFCRWPQDDIYYRCPRCQRLLEREFSAYCSSCGQCLDWHSYRKAKRTRFSSK